VLIALVFLPLSAGVPRAASLSLRPPGSAGPGGYARRVRLTDFWTRLEQAFGSTYARSLAADQSFSGLGGRTIDEAIAQGVETVTIWRAIVAAYPDRVPSRLH